MHATAPQPAAALEQEREPALPLRGDTVLGVCEALGEDFGFNPNWLRIAFCLPIFLYPVATFGAYVALGLVVLTSRLLFPKPRPAPEPVIEEAEPEPERLAA